MSPHDPGPLPEHYTVVDSDGIPDFAFSLPGLEKEALQLAGLLAANCDNPPLVSQILEDAAGATGDRSVYLATMLLRSIRFLTEDLFAPLLDVAERAVPNQDFRGHLAAVADPTSEAWGGKEHS